MASSHAAPVHRVKEVLQRMQTCVRDAAALQTCLGILATLSRDEANKLLIARDGIRLILSVMEMHLEWPGLQEAACDLLWSLAFNNALVKEVIGRYGGIPIVLAGMRAHAEKPDLLKSCCGALSNICQNQHNQTLIAAHGGIALILGALQDHEDQPDLLPFVFDALASLIVGNDANGCEVSDAGAIPSTLHCLRRHLPRGDLVKSACHALAILSDMQGQGAKIAAAGGARVVLTALRGHPAHSDLHRVAAVVLLRMLQEAPVASELARNGGVALLLAVMREQMSEVETVAACSHILFSITHHAVLRGKVPISIEDQLCGWPEPAEALHRKPAATKALRSRSPGCRASRWGVVASPGILVMVLATYEDRKDVSRTAIRALSDLCHYGPTAAALLRAKVLSPLLQVLLRFPQARDVVDGTASILKRLAGEASLPATREHIRGLVTCLRLRPWDLELCDILFNALKGVAPQGTGSRRVARDVEEELYKAGLGWSKLVSLGWGEKMSKGWGEGLEKVAAWVKVLTSCIALLEETAKGAGGRSGRIRRYEDALGALESLGQGLGKLAASGGEGDGESMTVLSCSSASGPGFGVRGVGGHRGEASPFTVAVQTCEALRDRILEFVEKCRPEAPKPESPPATRRPSVKEPAPAQAAPVTLLHLEGRAVRVPRTPRLSHPPPVVEDTRPSDPFRFSTPEVKAATERKLRAEPQRRPDTAQAGGSADFAMNPAVLATHLRFPLCPRQCRCPAPPQGPPPVKPPNHCLPSYLHAPAAFLPPHTPPTPLQRLSVAAMAAGATHAFVGLCPDPPPHLEPTHPPDPVFIAAQALADAQLEQHTLQGESLMRLAYTSCSAAGRAVPSRLPIPTPYPIQPPDPEKRFTHSLTFDACFESGNLLTAVQRDEGLYDLFLRADLHTSGFTQWFYFAVGNTHPPGVEGITKATFRICNLTKPDSLFNQGMRPVCYSMKDADEKGMGWARCGYDVFYRQNLYRRGDPNEDGDDAGKSKAKAQGQGNAFYYTLSFTVDFVHPGDTVLLAHSYPYTYSDQKRHLASILADPTRKLFVRRSLLCRSLGGHDVDLLTVTDFSKVPGGAERGFASLGEATHDDSGSGRRTVVVTGRVHPGEVPASWMMRGLLDMLTGPSAAAAKLRSLFVFKIVPMLNPDGVVLGNNRCGLSGVDLNRAWKNPSRALHPSIFHTKAMIRHEHASREVAMFLDLHGHSRKRNCFMYGCDDRRKPRPAVRVFPKLLSWNRLSGKFVSFKDCSFAVKKGREGTGRVVVAREVGIKNSYTLEATFCGADFGPLKDRHFGTAHYMEVGAGLADALLDYYEPNHQTPLPWAAVELPESDGGKKAPGPARGSGLAAVAAAAADAEEAEDLSSESGSEGARDDMPLEEDDGPAPGSPPATPPVSATIQPPSEASVAPPTVEDSPSSGPDEVATTSEATVHKSPAGPKERSASLGHLNGGDWGDEARNRTVTGGKKAGIPRKRRSLQKAKRIRGKGRAAHLTASPAREDLPERSQHRRGVSASGATELHLVPHQLNSALQKPQRPLNLRTFALQGGVLGPQVEGLGLRERNQDAGWDKPGRSALWKDKMSLLARGGDAAIVSRR